MANFMIGNFVTGTESNENPKTGRALSYIESINGDGTLNLKVVATIYGPEDNRSITSDGFFTNRDEEYYLQTTIHEYVEKYGLNNVYFMPWFENYGVKEKYAEIKIGALIIGNRNNTYGRTNRETLCFVENARPTSGWMDVVVLTNYTESSQMTHFEVRKDKFDTISIEEYFSKFPEAPINNENYKQYVLGGYYRYNNSTHTINRYVNNETVMNIFDRDYPVSDEITEKHTKAMMKAYGMFKYGVMHDATFKQVKDTNTAKAGLRNILSNNPNWDAENMWIRHSTDWKRPVVPQRITNFVEWFNKEMTKIYIEKSHKESGMDYVEISNSLEKVSRTVQLMKKLLANDSSTIIDKNRYSSVSLNGFHLDYFLAEEERLCKLKQCFHGSYVYRNGRYTYLSKEDGNLYSAITTVMYSLKDWIEKEGHILTADRAREINSIFSECHKPNGRPLIRVNKNMKFSRFIALLGRLTGVDKIVKLETISWYAHGEYCERVEDNGWNGRFAKFADGINPYTIRRHTIISTNPVDYLLASNGTSWISCHHLCREDMDRPGSYNAMCSGGASGYMNDHSTVVMYMIDESYDGNDFMFVPKERRCLFHIGEDKMIQGRVYPDGRDGGELGASEQMRTIMQTILADCLGVPNLWKVETGTSNIYPHKVTEGENYEDYCHYDDCTISFLKGNNSEYVINRTKIRIGADATCPVCGEKHNLRGWLYCGEHTHYYNKRDCDNAQYMVKVIEGSEENLHCCKCDTLVHRDDAIRDMDTDMYYCCAECAEADNVYYCFNTDNYHSRRVYYDDFRKAYFYDRRKNHITTRDGKVFINNITAENAGYVLCEDINEWVPNTEARYCETCDRYVTKENYMEEAEKCNTCYSYCHSENEGEGV